MPARIEQAEFNAMTESLEDDVLALFQSMQGDIAKYIDSIEDENPHDVIGGINGILSGVVDYQPPK